MLNRLFTHFKTNVGKARNMALFGSLSFAACSAPFYLLPYPTPHGEFIRGCLVASSVGAIAGLTYPVSIPVGGIGFLYLISQEVKLYKSSDKHPDK